MKEEAQLERAQRQLEELQRLARLGSWEFDVRNNHVTWTDGLYRIYGLTPDVFPATYEGYLERVHPDDRERVRRTIAASLEQGGTFEFEERIIRPDGAIRTLLSIGRTIRDNVSGEPIQIVGVCRDITDEKQAQQALLQREHQLAQAQQLAHMGSWSFDVAENSITWSDEMYRIYGMDKSVPLSYEMYIERIHPDDVEHVAANVRVAMADGSPFTHEHRIIRPDGTERVVLGFGEVERDHDGRVVRMLGTAQDITRRREAEEQARALIREMAAREEAESAATRLRFIADASIVLASSLDYEQTLQNVARLAVPVVADWCAVDIVTQEGSVKRLAVEHTDAAKVRFAMEVEDRYPTDPNAPTGVPNVLRTGEPEWLADIPSEMLEAAAIDDDHLRLIRELGLRSYAVIPLNVENETIGAITFVHAESGRRFNEHDMTLLQSVGRRAAQAIHNARLVRELSDAHTRLQQQSAEVEAQATELEEAMAELEMRNEELEAKTIEAESARDEAEQANAAKSQFLANMSHELRTPLNAIGGYAQLMELGVHGPITDAQRSALDRIKTNQARLLALINDLLNFVKLRAGRLDMTLSPERMQDILISLAPLVEPQVEEKGLILSIEGCSADLSVHTNRERMEQVLLNLVTNAIKFTPSGGRISISTEEVDSTVLIHVSDTGVGIPEDKAAEIFEPFVQLSQTPRRDNQGVGLGLAISKELMHGMGGDLTFESTVGVGSRFTMRVARATPSAVVTETHIVSPS